MFKLLTLNKKSFVNHYPISKEYNFTLNGQKVDGTTIQYIVIWQQNNLFSAKENISNKSFYYTNLNENHKLIQSFQQTLGFKEATSHIKMYEKRMKNALKIENIVLEGKLDNQTYVLSFQLTSPILNTKQVELQPGTDQTNYFITIIPEIFLYIALKREKEKFIADSDIKMNTLYPSDKINRPNFHVSFFHNWNSFLHSPHIY